MRQIGGRKERDLRMRWKDRKNEKVETVWEKE